MTILVVGASGATGRLLVEHLLSRGEQVRVIVRSPEKLPVVLKRHENLTIIHASLLDLDDSAIVQHTNGCVAVASCLGSRVHTSTRNRYMSCYGVDIRWKWRPSVAL